MSILLLTNVLIQTATIAITNINIVVHNCSSISFFPLLNAFKYLIRDYSRHIMMCFISKQKSVLWSPIGDQSTVYYRGSEHRMGPASCRERHTNAREKSPLTPTVNQRETNMLVKIPLSTLLVYKACYVSYHNSSVFKLSV